MYSTGHLHSIEGFIIDCLNLLIDYCQNNLGILLSPMALPALMYEYIHAFDL